MASSILKQFHTAATPRAPASPALKLARQLQLSHRANASSALFRLTVSQNQPPADRPTHRSKANSPSAINFRQYPSLMVDSVAQVKFSWDAGLARCRASAYDAQGRLLGEASVELPELVRTRIWAQRGDTARFRIEEATERHLRAMLDLRY